MTTFPSDEWFTRLAAVPRAQPDTFRRLGFADLRLVIEVTTAESARRFGLVLDGYDVLYAGELADVEAFRPDATLTGPVEAWAEMIDNISSHGGADGQHTLNALTIAEVPLRVRSTDPMGRDKFFRYAETLQELFDATAPAPARA